MSVVNHIKIMEYIHYNVPGMPSDIYYGTVGISFRMVSHPRKTDSDGDGYVDGPNDINGDGKINDPYPMVADVCVHELNSYINVLYNGSENWTNSGGGKNSYGGYQGWFYNDSDSKINDLSSKHIENGGCGIIASCDMLIYLEKQHGFSGLTPVNTSGAMLNYDEYTDFVRMYAKNYLTPIDVETPVGDVGEFLRKSSILAILLGNHHEAGVEIIISNITNGQGTWGTASGMIANAYKKYMSDKGYSYGMGFLELSKCTKKALISGIESSLSSDMPIILFSGVSADITLTGRNGNSTMHTHYVVITGIISYRISGTNILVVSSWGKQYTIDVEDYINHQGYVAGMLFI